MTNNKDRPTGRRPRPGNFGSSSSRPRDGGTRDGSSRDAGRSDAGRSDRRTRTPVDDDAIGQDKPWQHRAKGHDSRSEPRKSDASRDGSRETDRDSRKDGGRDSRKASANDRSDRGPQDKLSDSPKGARPHPHRNRRPPPSRAAPESDPVIFGNHAVEAALRNPDRTIRTAHFTENAELRFGELARARNITIEATTPRDLDRRLGADTVHQGVMVEVDPLPDRDLIDLVISADGRPILVLDQITDPHNVGAILRSAAVFNAAGIVMTHRNAPPLWGVLAKSASGALEQVPIASVQNLARALSEMAKAGCSIIGLDGEATALLEETQLTGPIVIVLGAEGKGLRQLTRDSCTTLAAISTDGPLASLNVSNAAAVALHLAAMQRRAKATAASVAIK